MDSLESIIGAINTFLAWLNAEPAVLEALALSLLLTEGVKQGIIPFIASPKTSTAHLRLALRLTAFLAGLAGCLFLWTGDLRHGLVWGLGVGTGSPLVYQALVDWGLRRGYDWAKRLRAADAILRRYKPRADDPAGDDEGTVLGAARKKKR